MMSRMKLVASVVVAMSISPGRAGQSTPWRTAARPGSYATAVVDPAEQASHEAESWHRYSTGPLPPYRFVPGQTPHPRRDPKGHGYGRPEPRATRIDPAAWASCAIYL